MSCSTKVASTVLQREAEGAREGELMAGKKGATRRKGAAKAKVAERTLEQPGGKRLTVHGRALAGHQLRQSLSAQTVRFSRLVLFLFRKRCCRRLPGLTVDGAPA